MDDLFQNKYRISSTRLPTWDYGQEGMYYITVCTRAHAQTLGSIKNGVMCLSDIGSIAYNNWLETPSLREDMNIQLGEFVVMPNHMHGIIDIGKNKFNSKLNCLHSIENEISLHLQPDYKNKFAPQSKNLSSIMRGYKSSVSSFAIENGIPFGWQARFHEHIIKSYEDYLRISRYIDANIGRWKDDCFYL